MRNPIIRSVLAVFGFWWSVAFILGIYHQGTPDEYFFLETSAKALAVAVIAFLLTFAVQFGLRWIKLGYLLETSTRGADCTIGILPGHVRWPRGKRVVVNAQRWPLVAAWMSSAPKEYKVACQAILDTINGKPDLPASPVTGGHGGVTLLQHTLNVMETGLAMMEKWTLDRRPNDPLYGSGIPSQDRHVAVLVLAGHDAGKMESFIMENGIVVERTRSHDREGARILATIDETWGIPEDDRKVLIAAVAYEHHPQDLPVRAGDTARLILEFLVDADAAASRKEESKRVLHGITDSSTEQTKALRVKEFDQEEDDAVWTWFMDFLAKPGTINGRSKEFRVAFKATDGKIFINDVSIRRTMANELYRDPTLAEVKLGDGRFLITENLLRILDAKGVLLKEWNGMRFTYKNALFKTVAADKNDKVMGEWSAAFVVDLRDLAPAGIRDMAPAPYPPRIVQPLWSQRALKSSQLEAEVDPEDSDKPVENEGWIEAPQAPAVENDEIHQGDDERGDPAQEDSLSGDPVDGSMPNSNDVPRIPPEDVTPVETYETQKTADAGGPDVSNESISGFGYGAGALSITPPDRGKKPRKKPSSGDDRIQAQKERMTQISSPPISTTDACHQKNEEKGLSLGYCAGVAVQCTPCHGPLAKSILKGMAQTGLDVEVVFPIHLSVEDAIKFAGDGGLNLSNMDEFVKSLTQAERVLKGVRLEHDDQGKITTLNIDNH